MWTFDIRNIAGIQSGQTTLDRGVNVVQAENWQGKSSFLAAIRVFMGTTGSDGKTHPLTDGASEGWVEVETESETYRTTLVRDGTRVDRQGEIYLTDQQDRTCARLFAFLGENNPIRETVRNGGDLAEQLTKPLDIENIDEKIRQLKQERRSVDAELQQATEAVDRIAAVQSTISELEQDIESLEGKREDLQVAASQTEEPSYEKLSDKEAEREQLANQIDTLENKIERQESRLRDHREKLEEVTVPEEPEFTSRIEDGKQTLRALETKINLLEDLQRVNKRILDEENVDLVTEIERTLSGDEMACWVCGELTSRSKIDEQLDGLQERLKELRIERDNIKEKINEFQERRDEIRTQQRQRDDLEAKISELRQSIDEGKSRLDSLLERRDTVTAELQTLREDVEEKSSRKSELEGELKYKKERRDELKAQVEELKSDAERKEKLQKQYGDLTAEIEELRSRRKRKKQELAETFEGRMAEIIDIFEPGFETARLVPKTDETGQITRFDLAVVRDGQETDLNSLSEGEVELLGIVTALAGYETFHVSDRVPVILLDGLAALSSANLHVLVEYMSDEADRLVTTAYPEIGDFDGHTLEPEEWDVVSDRQMLS